MTQHQESPVDLPGDVLAGGRPLAWTSVTIAVATLFLAATNATAINGWAVELEPSPLTARVAAASGWWLAATDRAGLGGPRAWVHARWEAAQAGRF